MIDPALMAQTLVAFYTLWQHKRGTRVMPSRGDFPFNEITPWVGRLHLVEVLPEDFRFKVFAGRSSTRLGDEWTGRLLSEVVPRWMAEDAAADYRRCVEICEPVYADRTRREAEGRMYSWRRLILPVGEGRTVDHLFVCMDYDFI
jgi:hypothetical protein